MHTLCVAPQATLRSQTLCHLSEKLSPALGGTNGFGSELRPFIRENWGPCGTRSTDLMDRQKQSPSEAWRWASNVVKAGDGTPNCRPSAVVTGLARCIGIKNRQSYVEKKQAWHGAPFLFAAAPLQGSPRVLPPPLRPLRPRHCILSMLGITVIVLVRTRSSKACGGAEPRGSRD